MRHQHQLLKILQAIKKLNKQNQQKKENLAPRQLILLKKYYSYNTYVTPNNGKK
jgi:hypothetical protein